MKPAFLSIFAAAAAWFVPALASAHVSVTSGPAFANVTQEIRFGVGHGCAGSDTYSIRIEIPAGVTSVRPQSSVFGKPSVEKNDAGDVIAVVWQKADIDVLDADVEYYELALRLKVPNQPFSTLYFPTYQICRAADGSLSNTDWVAMTEGDEAEPAPAAPVLPARKPGWNQFTVAKSVADLNDFFGDALIVWKGEAAFSANPTTAALVESTAGVGTLTSLAAGDEIWVKY